MTTVYRRMDLVAVLANGVTEKISDKQTFIAIICCPTIKLHLY